MTDFAQASVQAGIIAAAQQRESRDVLSIWTVYDHPRDYPHCYVARRFNANVNLPTDDIVTGTLDDIRQAMMMCGLSCLTRDPSDDANIVETWL